MHGVAQETLAAVPPSTLSVPSANPVGTSVNPLHGALAAVPPSTSSVPSANPVGTSVNPLHGALAAVPPSTSSVPSANPVGTSVNPLHGAPVTLNSVPLSVNPGPAVYVVLPSPSRRQSSGVSPLRQPWLAPTMRKEPSFLDTQLCTRLVSP